MSNEKPPFWIDNAYGLKREQLNAGRPYVACANGLVRLYDLKVLPHTPAYFNLWAFRFDYDPKAKCPHWLEYHRRTEPYWTAEVQEGFGEILGGIEITGLDGFGEHVTNHVFGVFRDGDSSDLLRRLKGEFRYRGLNKSDLPEKLVAELPGILNWAIEGWRLVNEPKLDPAAEFL